MSKLYATVLPRFELEEELFSTGNSEVIMISEMMALCGKEIEIKIHTTGVVYDYTSHGWKWFKNWFVKNSFREVE